MKARTRDERGGVRGALQDNLRLALDLLARASWETHTTANSQRNRNVFN